MDKSLKRLLDDAFTQLQPTAKRRAVAPPPPPPLPEEPKTKALESMVLSNETVSALTGDDEELARRATAIQLRAERAMAALERASVVPQNCSLYDSQPVLTVGHAIALENSLYRNNNTITTTPRAPSIDGQLSAPEPDKRDRRAYWRTRTKGRWRRYDEGMRLSLIAHSTSTVDMRFQKARDAVDSGLIKKQPSCLVVGCIRQPRALQLCRAHYQKQYRDIRRTQF